jgi:hypothetical protein
MIFQIQGISQILIGGGTGNTIYSNAKNTIEYVGDCDCNGLVAVIQDYNNPIRFDDCKIEIRYLRADTSTFEIRNQQETVIFDTLLLKNRNEIKAYLQIGNQLFSSGSIQRKDLQGLNKVTARYPCPWMKESKIYEFILTVVDEKGVSLSYNINTKSGKIPDRYRQEILLMKNPKKIYIDGVKFNPIKCSETINGISLDIKD